MPRRTRGIPNEPGAGLPEATVHEVLRELQREIEDQIRRAGENSEGPLSLLAWGRRCLPAHFSLAPSAMANLGDVTSPSTDAVS